MPMSLRKACLVASSATLLLVLGLSATTVAAFTVSVNSGTGAPLEDVVVSITASGESGKPRPPAGKAEIEQRNLQFDPPLLVIPTGTAVEFPNRDSTRHHVYSFSHAKTFEIRLYNGLPPAPIIFDQPGAVALGCNIHDQMQAYIYVTDADDWRLTDASGGARLAIPESVSKVSLELWHPRLRGDALTQVVKAPFPEELSFTLDVRPPLPRHRESGSSLQQRFDQLAQ